MSSCWIVRTEFKASPSMISRSGGRTVEGAVGVKDWEGLANRPPALEGVPPRRRRGIEVVDMNWVD